MFSLEGVDIRGVMILGGVYQKTLTEGHFQPEGQYQKVESGLLLWPSGVPHPPPPPNTDM